MQFKVPQNVQREDTIIGPVTMKQMIISGIGGGIAYAIYVVLAKSYFWEVWLWPVAFVVLLTAAIAFLKIHNIPFYKFIFLYLEYLILPRKRMWIKGTGDVFESILTPHVQKQKSKTLEAKAETDEEKLQKLEEISKILDSHGKVTTVN